MNLNDFAKEVHENAVAHGWWETDRSFAECICLIHSEWSEALEEARAGRPMVWHETYFDSDGKPVTVAAKPEGIAVEMMDGVIRILDLLGENKQKITLATVALINELVESTKDVYRDEPLIEILAYLHYITAEAGYAMNHDNKADSLWQLERCVYYAIWWVSQQGLDPEKILLEKHKYNTTRPYKHGKQF